MGLKHIIFIIAMFIPFECFGGGGDDFPPQQQIAKGVTIINELPERQANDEESGLSDTVAASIITSIASIAVALIGAKMYARRKN